MAGWKHWSASALLGMTLWTAAGAASTSAEMLREMFAVPPTEWRQHLQTNRRLLNEEFFTNVDRRIRWGIENNHVDDAFRFAMVGDFAAEVSKRPANYRIDLAELFFKAQNYLMTRQTIDNIIITSPDTPVAYRAQFLRGRLKEMEKDLFGAYQDYVELANKKYEPAETWYKAAQISGFRGELSLAKEEFKKAAAAGSKPAEIELKRLEEMDNVDWSGIAPAPNTSNTTVPILSPATQDPGQVGTPQPPLSVEDPVAKARLALADGRVDDAVADFQLAYDGKSLEIAREYGAALYRSGDLAKAKSILDQALVNHPNDVELLRFRGNTLERMYDREGQANNLKAALVDYQKALGLEPSHALLPWEIERAKAKSK